MTSTDPSVPTTEPDALATVLDLRPGPVGALVGRSLAFPWPAVYGGQLVAQCVVAAGRLVGGVPCSLHGTFVRAAVHERPLTFTLDGEPVRAGGPGDRPTTIARVQVAQGGEAVFLAATSMVDAPVGEVLVTDDALPTGEDEPAHPGGPDGRAPGAWDGLLEVRATVDPTPGTADGWIRVPPTGAADPLARLAELAFTTDVFATDPVMTAQPDPASGPPWPLDRWISTSLDHHLWFHRLPVPGAWLRTSLRCDGIAGGRGLATGAVTDPRGRPVVTVAQEHLVRRRGPTAPAHRPPG